jgi:tetratricopeptide (TPR) repeat protein
MRAKYESALHCFERCREIEKRTLGQDPPRYAVPPNIGSVYWDENKYEMALTNYEECREICQKTLGQDHLDYAVTLNNIGLVSTDQAKYEMSLQLYKKLPRNPAEPTGSRPCRLCSHACLLSCGAQESNRSRDWATILWTTTVTRRGESWTRTIDFNNIP